MDQKGNNKGNGNNRKSNKSKAGMNCNKSFIYLHEHFLFAIQRFGSHSPGLLDLFAVYPEFDVVLRSSCLPQTVEVVTTSSPWVSHQIDNPTCLLARPKSDYSDTRKWQPSDHILHDPPSFVINTESIDISQHKPFLALKWCSCNKKIKSCLTWFIHHVGFMFAGSRPFLYSTQKC